MMDTRIELIEDILMEHGKVRVNGVLACRCGHVYRMGASIHTHRAEVIDAALKEPA